MRLPWVARHRLENAERELKYKAINLERLSRHLEEANANATNAHFITDQLTEDLRTERERGEQLRKEYAGDLQLAHTRYDEFVRDMLDKVIAPQAPAAAARSSNPQEEKLPDVVQSAIDEFSFGNPIIAEQLTAEAWRRVKRNEKAEEIAEKILAGETPD